MYALIMKISAIAMIWHGIRFNADYSIDHGVALLCLAILTDYIELKIRKHIEKNND